MGVPRTETEDTYSLLSGNGIHLLHVFQRFCDNGRCLTSMRTNANAILVVPDGPNDLLINDEGFEIRSCCIYPIVMLSQHKRCLRIRDPT